ncbi:SDR family oxidoreductase [Marinobacter sp. NFXS9]|uniref:SDR family NAD(P)-dependent oxidoreductase n=1 Tax=Marinobacter sp. NFXS9 TaxID=2818433 RepID=UPI0032DFAEFE
MSRRTALVTGASAGIGKGFAEKLASQGYDLVLVARRRERLEALGTDLQARFGVAVHIVAEDLGDSGAVDRILRAVDDAGLHVDFLVNNAGFAARTSLVDSDWSVLNQEIQVMVTALTELMVKLGRRMVKRGYGHIINVASLAAFAPSPAGMLYTGIKNYVVNVSESADMEFRQHGVRVTALCPGFTYTEFHDVQGTREQVSRLPSILWQDVSAVVEEGYRAALAGKPVCVPGRFNKVIASVSGLLPESVRYQLGRRGRIY